MIRKITPKQAMDAVLIAATIIMGIVLNWKIVEIVIFCILIWIILNPVSSRIPAVITLAILFFVPIMLLFGKIDLADRLSNYVYYFLIMTILMGLYEIRSQGTDNQI